MAEITDADTDDANILVEMWLSLADGQRQYGSHIPPESNRTQIRESILRHITTNRLLLAREDDIQGFVMFSIERGDFEQDATRGIVENLYVQSESRGEGIGSQLLASAEQRLHDRGADTIALNVMADNEDARRFYRDHGYTPHRLEVEKSLDRD